jgi:hypothetical protein
MNRFEMLKLDYFRPAYQNIINNEVHNKSGLFDGYKANKPYPSCLIYGKDKKGDPIHIVCAFSPIIRVITIYHPDENKWIEYKRRK